MLSHFLGIFCLYNAPHEILVTEKENSMKNKKRAIAVIALVFTLITVWCFPMGAYAAENERTQIQPRWNSILSIDGDITFCGTDGNATGMASKQSTASLIEGTLVLYRQSGDDWIYMDEDYNSKSRGTLAVSIDFEAVSGVTYKFEFTVTAYTNGVGETKTIEYSETCP